MPFFVLLSFAFLSVFVSESTPSSHLNEETQQQVPVAPMTNPYRRPDTPVSGTEGRRYTMRRGSLPAVRYLLALAIAGLLGMAGGAAPASDDARADAAVTITDQGTYYSVLLDYTTGITPRAMGQAYARAAKRTTPDIERLIDSCFTKIAAFPGVYQMLVTRAQAIRPQIDPAYRDEIEGFASQFSGGATDVAGDGKLSTDEVYLLNLLPDIAHVTQCSALSVFGARSATGSTITARLLDWLPLEQLPRGQTVTTIRRPGRSVCLIGFVGFMGAITGFNSSGVFAALLDSDTGVPYVNPKGMRSYALDLRHALESEGTLSGAAGYMADTNHHYAYNHLIFFSDPKTSKVLENDLTSKGPLARTFRASDSPLRPGVTWGISDALACVNSYLLPGNHDNHTGDKSNYARWQSIRTQLLARGPTVTRDDLKAIASYHSPTTFNAGQGDVYNDETQMIVIFEPATMALEVAFRPRNNVLPAVPIFTRVPVSF